MDHLFQKRKEGGTNIILTNDVRDLYLQSYNA